MQRGKRKGGEASASYERLVEGHGESVKGPCKKGYVPVLVGSDGERAERFLVPIMLLKDPCILALLDKAEQEFGLRQEGILRLPCDAEHFRHVLDVISKHK